MTYSLSGKNAVVTGASRGIGLAIAQTLAANSAAVAICATKAKSLENAVTHLTSLSTRKVGGKVADVRNSTEVTGFFEFVDTELGGLDILVNNAGVGVFKSTAEMSIAEWHATLD